jgi:hypothetical protein
VAAFLALVTTFPVVVYTVLLGASLVYWVFVVIGAVSLDSHHADGGLDLDGDGIPDHLEHADGADGHHDGADGHHETGGLAGMMAALKLRSAPATVVLSVLVLFSWIFSIVGLQLLSSVLPVAMMGAVKLLLLILAPLLALFPTSLAVRPLARIFAPPRAVASKDLVGKLCTIRTGTVTEKFGEATLDDGGAGLVVRVRVDSGQKLGRGQQAVILGYDDERHEYTVAPMDAADEDDEKDEPKQKAAR